MKTLTAALAASVMFFAIGCAPKEQAAETTSSTPATSTASTASASEDTMMATCGLCGKEVDAATLVSHDGVMACEACVEAHGH